MKNYKRSRFARRLFLVIILLLGIAYLNRVTIMQKVVALGTQSPVINLDKQNSAPSQNDELANLNYSGQTVIAVNNNQPTFTAEELQIEAGGWQKLSALDWLGRPQAANALLNQKLMPPSQKETARERLTIHTPGYHAIKTGNNPTDWLYNRSHLIGYQFTGLNNESKNLITGTRQLNADSRVDAKSMVTYETEIANYLHQSKSNYLRYQVTPIYKNVELVPRGVHMMAQSVDGNFKFNEYLFNVQDGWDINYLNGNATRSEK